MTEDGLSGSPCRVPPSTHHLIPRGLLQSGREGREWGGSGVPDWRGWFCGSVLLGRRSKCGPGEAVSGSAWGGGQQDAGAGGGGEERSLSFGVHPGSPDCRCSTPLPGSSCFCPCPQPVGLKSFFSQPWVSTHCHSKLAAGVLSVLPSSFFWHLLQTPQTPDPPSTPILGVLDTGATRRSFSVPQLSWA